ncbi:MAG: BlaI/MecI/CopY family transcriptional regulator [Krumholzibacteria bacterium]|nr:BlaI/MecI/CopY family transcriptional regulator [Candidatus Krumholzibacteria bacterium]
MPTRPKPRKLTPAEWEVMQAAWDLDRPVSVRDVLEHLYPGGEKAYTTVQTVLNTLEKKKLLGRRKTGLVNFYTPVRSRDETTRSEMSSLVSRVFGGSVPALANTLMSLDDVDLADLAEIKRLIARRERELKEGGS